MNQANLNKLVGKTIKKVTGLNKNSEEVTILFNDNSIATFFHEYDCCEDVVLYDFELTAKSLDSLIGAVVNDANETTSKYMAEDPEEDDGTWTFYNINTSKGCINMRWLGTSNGYYSEEVTVTYKEV